MNEPEEIDATENLPIEGWGRTSWNESGKSETEEE